MQIMYLQEKNIFLKCYLQISLNRLQIDRQLHGVLLLWLEIYIIVMVPKEFKLFIRYTRKEILYYFTDH